MRESKGSRKWFSFFPLPSEKNTRRRVLFSNGERVRYESEFWNMMMIKKTRSTLHKPWAMTCHVLSWWSAQTNKHWWRWWDCIYDGALLCCSFSVYPPTRSLNHQNIFVAWIFHWHQPFWNDEFAWRRLENLHFIRRSSSSWEGWKALDGREWSANHRRRHRGGVYEGDSG